MSNGGSQVVQVDFPAVPRERMIVATIANPLVVNRVIFNRNPPSACRVDFASLEQLTFLNLEMDNAILLVKANSRYDPETICI